MRPEESHLLRTIKTALASVVLLIVCLLMLVLILFLPPDLEWTEEEADSEPLKETWKAPDSTSITNTPEGELIRYGKELIIHTAVYLGPGGKVSQNSNGMNCQNCHLNAGRKFWGNNYSAVASTYPKFRARSGSVETVEKRVNDCIERSLNGQPLQEDSREMRALVAYIGWVGSQVPRGEIPDGSGIADLGNLERAADPLKGEAVYISQCLRCHGVDGEGMKAATGQEWLNPPLWGDNSFNTGAGILRISRMAGFVHRNMPNDIEGVAQGLTEEEAWDVAAYVCSKPRPAMDMSADWPDVSLKPVDHPFGPYRDTFSEMQHKYGPFGQMPKAVSK